MNEIQFSGQLKDDVEILISSRPDYKGYIAILDVVTESGEYSCHAFTGDKPLTQLKKGDHVTVDGKLWNNGTSDKPMVTVRNIRIHGNSAVEVRRADSDNDTPAVPVSPPVIRNDKEKKPEAINNDSELASAIDFIFRKL